MTTITLQLTAFRGWSATDRSAASGAYFRALGLGMPQTATVTRILNDIGNAVATLSTPTVAIDITGATTLEMAAVVSFLTSFGETAPKEIPPDWVSQFIIDAEAGSPALATRRRMDGVHPR